MLRDVVTELQEGGAGSQLNVEKVLPRLYSLAALAKDLPECHANSRRHFIQGLLLCLEKTERIERVTQDDEYAAQIASHVAGFLDRSPNATPRSCGVSDVAPSADEVLSILKILIFDYSACIDDAALLSVVAYTDSRFACSTESASFLARDILDHQLISKSRKHDFITSVVLEGFIRPIFSRSSSNRITMSGRKAHFVDVSHDRSACHEETEIWKQVQPQTITVFAWAVEQADVCREFLIGRNWPLFTPVLLSLLDDTNAVLKESGLTILRNFLERCPARVLRDTGLGEIFEQSVFPSVLSLPTLTPEDESLALLDAAYKAILGLASAEFPDASRRHQKNQLLARLVKEGLLAGYWHASEYPKIVELLARHAATIIQDLGIFTVQHLKELLSMLTAILADPFFVSCPTCIKATSQALMSTMLNCWPRISHPSHSGEVLRAICSCWLNLRDEKVRAPDNVALEEALASVSSLVPLLSAIFTSAGLSPLEQFSPLCDAEPRLVELFGHIVNEPGATLGEADGGDVSRVAAA